MDLVARFNGKYVIGEAKSLTDFGGHQNAQFNDAIATIKTPELKAVPIAILDGVLFIPGRNKMYRKITTRCGRQRQSRKPSGPCPQTRMAGRIMNPMIALVH